MTKAPLQEVKDKFGSKEKLVDEILAKVKKSAEISKDEFKQKLLRQSNSKLLALHGREEQVHSQFGTREGLVDSIMKSHLGKKKQEDAGFRSRLGKLTNGELLSLSKGKRVAANETK